MSGEIFNVLLVEDNPGDARLIREMLRESSNTLFRLECADCLSAAKDILRDKQFDMILLDLSLPDSRGLDTFTIAQAYALQTPIIVLSGLDDQMIAIKSVQSGAQDYLVKGQVDSNLLARAIRYAIERKRAEMERARLLIAEQEARAKAEAAEQRFRDLVNSIDGIVWEADVQTFRFSFVSKQAERLLGHPTEMWVTEPTFWDDHVHPDDRNWAKDYCVEATRQKRDHEFEYRMIAADGRVVWLKDIVTVVVENDRAAKLRGVMVDISEPKRAEQERIQLLAREQAARKEAEEANRLKDEFLATVSHELRTPLNAILGWARMLLSSRLDEAMNKRAVETIERNAKSQAQLINDLLDVSRIITGKLRLDVTPVELVTILDEALDTVRLAAEAKGIQLQLELSPDTGPILGDADRLQQVIWNLLSNAIKFTPRGGRVGVKIVQVKGPHGPQVEIAVSDTGQGISPKFLPYVFDRFRQADSTTSRRHGGLGLGLAIVRHLVELHGGMVHADSPGEGKGATFTVRLPITAYHIRPMNGEPGHMRSVGETLELTSVLNGLRILVVDDEDDMREILTTVLAQCKAEVKTAGSAAEGLEVFKQWQPDVLVCDIEMPDEDGYSLIQKVRTLESQLGRQTPAVAVTAYARSEDRIRALAAGYQVHIPKPVELAEIVAVIERLSRRNKKGFKVDPAM